MSKQKNNTSKVISLNRRHIVELLILTGLAVLLLLYLLFRTAANFAYTLPRFDEISGIQRIRWSQGDGTERILSMKDSQWYIDQYPAKQSNVTTLMEQLSQPGLQDMVSRSDNLLTFGLDPERAYTLEALNDQGETLRTLYVGKSSSSGRYSFVRLSEDDLRVYTISENLSSILEKSIDDLRDRLVVSFPSNEIVRLEILETATEKNIAIEKHEDEWQIPEGVNWGEEQITALVNRLSNLNAQRFLTEYPPNPGGEYKLKFVDANGVTYTITVAATALENDEGYAAKSSTYDFPFTLNTYTVENVLEDFGFVEKEESE